MAVRRPSTPRIGRTAPYSEQTVALIANAHSDFWVPPAEAVVRQSSEHYLRPAMMTRGTLTLLAGLLAMGCGDDSGDGPANGTGATGGGTGTGGVGGGGSATGGTGTGGGSPSGTLNGAVSLNILGAGCSLGDRYIDFPEVVSGHPVTATDLGELVTHEENTATGERVNLVCNWHDGWVSIALRIGVMGKSVSFQSTTVPGEADAGGIGVSDPSLPEPYGSSGEDPCVFSVIQVDEGSNTIWGQVSCGILENELGTDRCALGTSYFYFENCTDA